MKKYKRKELGLTSLVAIGTLASITTVVVTALILAVISSLTKNPTSLTAAFSLLTLVLAGSVSGFVISRIIGGGGSLVGTLSIAIATALMLMIGLICKGGLLPLGAILNMLVFLAVGIIASILGKRRPRKKHRY